MLERPGRDKHSSLLGKLVNYGRRKFLFLAVEMTNENADNKTKIKIKISSHCIHIHNFANQRLYF
jgi:hypothetical protein